MQKTRIILHIDMNAFFASCAIINEPYLKDKVFAIGGPSGYTNRGVLSTASYQARKLGINSGMSITDAQKIYPKLLIVPTDFTLYSEMSKKFIEFLRTYTKQLLIGSIDEAYLDITEISKYKHPELIAKEIQDKLLSLHQLPSSIGIAPTLFLAKMASDLKKPLGITVLRKRDIPLKLYHLDVAKIFGVGKKTYEKLYQINIKTINDFINPQNKEKILTVMSVNHYLEIISCLEGKSSNIVDPDKYSLPKSISAETTLINNSSNYQIVFEALNEQFERVFQRLIDHQMLTRTIGFRVKYSDFTVLNRSVTLFDYTIDKELIRTKLEFLFTNNYDQEEVRLIGFFASNLIKIDEYQKHYDLFNYQQILNNDIIKKNQE